MESDDVRVWDTAAIIGVQGRVKTLPYRNWILGVYSALVVTEIRVLAISLNTL